MPDLYHVTDLSLNAGAQILPGRFGAQVLSRDHPLHRREHVMDEYRLAHTQVAVSRLACTYAFESLADAMGYRKPHEFIYLVQPTDADAPRFRADMVLVGWVGEYLKRPEGLESNLARYWSSALCSTFKPEATPTMEVLIGGSLEVIEQLAPG